MGILRRVKMVRPICAVTFAPDAPESIAPELEALLGPVQMSSEVFDFSSFTSYYLKEMGDGLKKQFHAFFRLIHPGDLAGIKNKTNALEIRWSSGSRRRVNLDPGYVTGSKLVLASTKDFAHRIYIGEGMYGDLQLQYRHDRFWAQNWTYPDYQTENALRFFSLVRSSLVREDRDEKKNEL